MPRRSARLTQRLAKVRTTTPHSPGAPKGASGLSLRSESYTAGGVRREQRRSIHGWYLCTHLRLASGVELYMRGGGQTMTWRYISREERKVRSAALKMRRMMFRNHIMSAGAMTRANEILQLRHHLCAYQDRQRGTSSNNQT